MLTSKKQEIYNGLLLDVMRLILLLGFDALLFWLARWAPQKLDEPALAPILNTNAILVFICVASHVIRRILFPEVTFAVLVKKAMETPEGAARVFQAVCLVLAVIIYGNVILLK